MLVATAQVSCQILPALQTKDRLTKFCG